MKRLMTLPTRAWQWVIAAACILVATNGGCALYQGLEDNLAYNDLTNEFVLGWRNGVWANQAWLMRKHQFVGHPYLDHFGEGFKAGYVDVASGGNGCTPALPPRHYWTWKYQTPEGQAKVAAWFDGYPHGARAAEEDGAGNWSQIQVSERLRAEFRLGHEAPYRQQIFMHNPQKWCPPGEEQDPSEPIPMQAPATGGVPQASLPAAHTPTGPISQPQAEDPSTPIAEVLSGTGNSPVRVTSIGVWPAIGDRPKGVR